MNKIALLFLTRQDLNHADFWQKKLEGNEELFNIYIHSKEPMKHPFFRPFTIPEYVPTLPLYHVKAWQALIREAIKSTENTSFIYLSESCIPLYPLEQIYHYLMYDSNRTYIRYSRPWWPQEAPREVSEFLPNFRWGNAEWVILNRKHAELIANDQEIINSISTHPYDSESYPATLFGIKGCLEEMVYRKTSYASWAAPTGPYPYAFKFNNYIEETYIQNAKKGACLFARKFTSEFPSEALFSLVEERLLPPPSTILRLPRMIEEKIIFLQSQEEMSEANASCILPLLLEDESIQTAYEIGAGLGLHMERLLEAFPISQYYAIESFRRKNYKGIPFSSEEEEYLFNYTKNRIESLGQTLLRSNPLELAKTLPDQSIDLLFINSEHDSTPLQDILEAWFPKIRKGGYIFGYQNDIWYPEFSLSAILFFGEKNLILESDIIEPKLYWVHV